MTAQPSLRRRDLIITVLFVAALYIAWVLRTTLMLIYVSLIIAVVFSPAVDWVRRRRVGRWSPGRGAAILILVIAALVLIGTFVSLLVPPIARDSQQLASQLPSAFSQLRHRLQALPFGASLAEHINTQSLENALRSLGAAGLRIFRGITGGVMSLISIALVAAYFILDGRRAFHWSMSLVPASERDRLAATLGKARARMQSWLMGQLALMLILGSLTAIVLGLLGVRYFYAIAVFAGLANFIPILGPIATVILAGIVAAIDSWAKLLGVLIFYFVYQQVENAYLTPRIMRSTVDLPGIAVIISLAIGGELAGILGAMVAVPTAALVATIVHEYLVFVEEKQSAGVDAGTQPVK